MDSKIKEEIANLRKAIDNLERKYAFTSDYKLITTLLDMMQIDNLEISYNEIEKRNNVSYIAKFDDINKTITIKRYDPLVEQC